MVAVIVKAMEMKSVDMCVDVGVGLKRILGGIVH